MSTGIAAPRGRVWRAITVPDEVLGWDDRARDLLDRVDGYPTAGQHVRWRYRLGPVTILLHDRPQEVVPETRLRSAMALGLFRFEESWSLVAEAGDGTRTRLGLKIVASNSIPVLGGRLDRFAVRGMAAELVDRKLRAIREWCEAQPASRAACEVGARPRRRGAAAPARMPQGVRS